MLNDTSFESHHGCETVMQNISTLLLVNGIEVIGTNPVGKDWEANSNLLKQMTRSDIVIVNGEGTLHHSQPIAEKLITVAQYVKEHIGIPIVLINATYQSNGVDFANYVRYFDMVYVREGLSRDDLAQHGINSTVVPDLTFYSTFDLSQKMTSQKIGVSDSVYEDLSSGLYQLSLANKYKYLPALTHPDIQISNVSGIVKYLKYNIFRWIARPLSLLGVKFDYRLLRVLHYIDNYQSYVQEIASLDFLVAARYHSLCFALKTLTPFVALESNSHKVEGMLEDIGIGRQRMVKQDELHNLDMKKFSEAEVDLITKYVENAPRQIEYMFQEISKLLNKPLS